MTDIRRVCVEDRKKRSSLVMERESTDEGTTERGERQPNI